MKSPILSTFLCSAVVASCVFADIANTSKPNSAQGGGLSSKALLSTDSLSTSKSLSSSKSLASNDLPLSANSLSSNDLPLSAKSLSNTEFSSAKGLNSAQNPSNNGIKAQKFPLLAQNSSENQSPENLPSNPALNSSENSAQGTLPAYQLGAVEVTAPKELDYNPSVATISAKDIRDKNANNVAQAVRMTPGVFMREATSQRGEPSINIRGYGYTQIGLYLDGIPMMSIYDRQTDFSQYVTQGIDSIQISKGFTSPVYGMTSLGGAINMVSSRPEKELEIDLYQRLIVGRHSSPDEIRQGFNIGTNQGKYYFSAGVSHTNRLQYPLSSDFKRTIYTPSYDKPNSYYKNATAKLKAGIQPNENHEYSLNFIYQSGEKGGLHSDDSSGQWWKWPHYDKTTVYLLGNSFFTPDISLNTRLYYDNFYNELDAHGNGTAPGNNINWKSFYDDDTYGAILTLNLDLAERTNLKVGTNLKYDHHYSYNENDVVDANLQELVSSEFIQLSQGVWNFRFVLAATYDRADTFKEFTDDGSKAADMGHNFSLQGVVYYDFAEGNSLHINVGKKQNLPTLKQRYSEIWGYAVPNPDLSVESAMNYEIGYDLASQSTRFSVAAFYNDMDNMFVAVDMPNTACSAGTGCWQNKNADSGYTFGGEIGIEQGFFADDMLVLGLNYSYIYKKASELDAGTDDYGNPYGKKITNYPNHIANAKIAIKPLKSLEFIALGTFESAADYNDTTTTGSGRNSQTRYIGYKKGADYFTLDLSARYEFVPGLSVDVGVRNLTDRDNYSGAYASKGTDSATYHYAGRQWFAGFEYRY